MTIPSLFLSVAVLLVLSQYAAADVHINLTPSDMAAICTKSLDKDFCLNFLKTTPGITTTDLKGACLMTLEAARAEAGVTEKLISTLVGQTSDPKTKEGYTSCMSSYGDAADNIETAKASLASGDYNGVNIQAAAAQTDVNDCDEGVKGTEVSTKNQHLVKVLGIVLIIANQLPKV
ncbi:Pectinesterase inhibitor [Linum grandiflorum]